MPKRALSEKRPFLLAALAAALAWYLLEDARIGGAFLIPLKGLGVALLGTYALVRHSSLDARLLALVMGLGALGDMLVELDWTWGGAAFFLGHIVAIVLFLRNGREKRTPSQAGAAACLLIFTPAIGWLLTRDLAVTAYSLALGAMAAAAWTSRFSRYRIGIGAVLFVVSDWLIFARMDGMATAVADWLVWPLYFGGQFLICTGVIQTLRGELPKAS